MWAQSLGIEDTLEEEMATYASILAWEIHGQRSLMGYSPWSCNESDTARDSMQTHSVSSTLNNSLAVSLPTTL